MNEQLYNVTMASKSSFYTGCQKICQNEILTQNFTEDLKSACNTEEFCDKFTNTAQLEALTLGVPQEYIFSFSNIFQIQAVGVCNTARDSVGMPKRSPAWIEECSDHKKILLCGTQESITALKHGIPLSEAYKFKQLEQIYALLHGVYYQKALQFTQMYHAFALSAFVGACIQVTNQTCDEILSLKSIFQSQAFVEGVNITQVENFNNRYNIAALKSLKTRYNITYSIISDTAAPEYTQQKQQLDCVAQHAIGIDNDYASDGLTRFGFSVNQAHHTKSTFHQWYYFLYNAICVFISVISWDYIACGSSGQDYDMMRCIFTVLEDPDFPCIVPVLEDPDFP